MDDNRSPADRLLDLIVFGPAGLALTAAEEFPKLVDKGRSHLEGQVRTARIVGQVAVQMGRRQFDQFTAPRVSKSPSSSPSTSSTSSSSRAPASSPPVVRPHPSPEQPPAPEAPEVDASVGVAAHANGNGSSVPLAIPGYDSLSASQVVQRLAGLSRGELIDVRAHEESHRHRRTILNRVEQLLAGVDAE